MRVLRLLVVVAAAMLVSACATLRPTPDDPRVATAAPAVPAPEAPPAAKEPELRIACVPERAVDSWEQRYRAKPGEWEGHLEHPGRGGRYLSEVQRMVDEAGLPPEIAFLPTLESGYRSDVHGLGGSGLWQLGAATARRYGLVVSGGRDDRLNAHLSTQVAIRHLQDLYERYQDWPLALAAYNAGEGRVDRALKLSPGASFWDLAEQRRLPAVTCTYVPKLLGLARVAHPDDCPEDVSADRHSF